MDTLMSKLSTPPTFTHTGTILHIARANSSVNGNPAFFVRFEDGMRLRTQTDSGVSYEIENYSPARHPEPVIVTLSRAGRIIAIRSAVTA